MAAEPEKQSPDKPGFARREKAADYLEERGVCGVFFSTEMK
jgi:hypothetical protein